MYLEKNDTKVKSYCLNKIQNFPHYWELWETLASLIFKMSLTELCNIGKHIFYNKNIIGKSFLGHIKYLFSSDPKHWDNFLPQCIKQTAKIEFVQCFKASEAIIFLLYEPEFSRCFKLQGRIARKLLAAGKIVFPTLLQKH